MVKNKETILKCGVQSWLILLIGFMIGLGMFLFHLIGIEKIKIDLTNETFASGFYILRIAVICFLFPTILLFYLRKIHLNTNGLVISYLLRTKKTHIDYSDVKSFVTIQCRR